MVTEFIAKAAILFEDSVYTVEQPGRHHDVMRMMFEQHGIDGGRGEQGFVTSRGDFVRRAPALRIAEKAGQLDKVRPKTFPKDVLFSEDVW